MSQIDENLRNETDFRTFLRRGLLMVMTRDLQLTCSYAGRGGYAVCNLNCVNLIQGKLKLIQNICESNFSQFQLPALRNFTLKKKRSKRVPSSYLSTLRIMRREENQLQTISSHRWHSIQIQVNKMMCRQKLRLLRINKSKFDS